MLSEYHRYRTSLTVGDHGVDPEGTSLPRLSTAKAGANGPLRVCNVSTSHTRASYRAAGRVLAKNLRYANNTKTAPITDITRLAGSLGPYIPTARPITEPSRAPAIPRPVVTRNPASSLPGTRARAKSPTTNPTMMVQTIMYMKCSRWKKSA
jgi:hypothetical protein